MPRLSPDDDFNIYVDPSDFGYSMDSEDRRAVSPKPAHVQDETESELHPSIEGDEHTSTMGEEDKHASTLDHQDEGADSSSQHDEDVFSDKSHRSSIGSYDGGSESGKGSGDGDNMTTIRSPRISDIGTYDKDDFIPTSRETPRPPFRTPSDVRAMQMTSPTPSVLGSPRAAKKQFPTVSRLGTPSGSAQYSPKRKSTPPRFKSRQEAPLVLLHVTMLPLRWVWGDIVNNLEPAEMSNQAKTLRDAWQMLQDRVGDTVIERGILLGHPQNDYEVLEERLLDALELPLRRRARILECGHYLGPANESTISEDEDSEDDYDDDRRHAAANKRHWCKTCKHDIRYESLGADKIFRVKVYASNGLMKAGAWAACWKEMERVDVELEPVVEGAVQDEIVRLAAQQDPPLDREEDDSYVDEMEEPEEPKRSSFNPNVESPPPRESSHHRSQSAEQRHRDAERFREIYGHSPPTESHAQESESYSPHHTSTAEGTYERDNRRHATQQASMPQLLVQSARVLIQDRKNIVIFTLGVLVLMLALRNAPRQSTHDSVVSGINSVPEMHQVPVVEVSEPVSYQEYQEYQSPVVAEQDGPTIESIMSMAGYEQQYDIVQDALPNETPQESIPEAAQEVDQATSVEVQTLDITIPSSNEEEPLSAVSEPISVQASIDETPQASTKEIEAPQSQLEVTETVTQKRVVRVFHTVTETETQTQTQTATETLQVHTTQVVEAFSDATVEAQDVASAPEAEPSSKSEEREPIVIEAGFASASAAASLDDLFDYSAFEAEADADTEAEAAPSETKSASASASETETVAEAEVVPEPTQTPLTAAEVEALLEEQDQKPFDEEDEDEAATDPAGPRPERASPFVDLGELPEVEADAKDAPMSPLASSKVQQQKGGEGEEEEEEPFTLAKACEAFLVNRELHGSGIRIMGVEQPEATTPAEDLVCGGSC